MAVALRCDRCGRNATEYTTVQTNYSLSRHPRRVRVCAACTAAAEADEAPRLLRRQMEQVIDLDAGAAHAGMPVDQRDALFRAGGLADAFEALLAEVR